MTHDKNRQIGKSENMKFSFAPICKKAQIGESENMKFPFSPLCKKAQIGETMTWVVATSIIVLVLIVAIFVTSILGVVGAPKEYYSRGFESNLLPVKSLTSYLLTKDLEGSGKNIFEKLKEDENSEGLNGENGKFASDVFSFYYNDKYSLVWLGINIEENNYSGSYSKIVAWETQTQRLCKGNFIFLKENKWLKLFLCA